MNNFDGSKYSRMLFERFSEEGGVPKAAPPSTDDPIDRMNASLEAAGLGCMVSVVRYEE